ncbi:MAG: Bug family tripartite tricarboxylate transporter substrate binding protein [Beijerinckiaceae bacterium]
MFGKKLLAAAIALLGMGGAAGASDLAEFYKNNPLRIIVGYDNGGGYDVYARILARHMPRHLPGSPTAIVQNMPGAGSLVAVNYIYNVAPKDGSTIATFARNMAVLGILGTSKRIKFDIRKLTWLGSSSSYAEDAYILWLRKDAKAKSLEEARKPGGPTLILGGTNEGSTGSDVPKILADTINLNVRQILGYKGSGGLFLAIDRGEIEGRITDLSAVRSNRPQYLKPDSYVRPVLQFARETRHPDFPNIPTARELAKDKESLAFIELAELPFKLARPYAAPPGLPKDRAEALQKAFMASHSDPKYIEEAKKLNIGVSPIDGKAVLAMIDKISQAPKVSLDKMRALYDAAEAAKNARRKK